MTAREVRAIILIILVGCGATTKPLRAQCISSPLISVWPSLDTRLIQPRQVFLFSGTYTGGTNSPEQLVPLFGKTIHAYLWSAHDSVELLVRERFEYKDAEAWHAHAQVLLQPSRPLLPHSTYELRVFRAAENLFYMFRSVRPAPGKRWAIAHRWKVSAVADTQAPVWTTTPSVKTAKYEDNSEGTENYVMFSYPLRDTSSCLVRTTVCSVSDGAIFRFIIQPWQGQLPIGWFTCGGDVRFKSEGAYTVSFEAIDSAGNRAFANGVPIPFQAPKKVACCWGN